MDVLINTPWLYRRMTILAFSFIILLMIFIFFCFFRSQHIFSGTVSSSEKVVFVRVTHPGWIKAIYVKEGQHVKKGQPLFLLNSSDELYPMHGKKNTLEQQWKTRILRISLKIKQKKQEIEALMPLFKKKYIDSLFFEQKKDELFRLKEAKNMIEAEQMRYRAEHLMMIRAPKAGSVGSMNMTQGSRVVDHEVLLSLVPIHPMYRVDLRIPMHRIAKIHRFDSVVLRYDSYPYQHFGVDRGIIEWIDEVVSEGQYYKAIVSIDQKSHPATINLLNGMTCSGVVLGERKKIWKWLKEGLYL